MAARADWPRPARGSLPGVLGPFNAAGDYIGSLEELLFGAGHPARDRLRRRAGHDRGAGPGAGGRAGGGALAYVYCDGASLSTLNFNTFSQVAFDFRVACGLLTQGLVWALVIGMAGGLLPAIRAASLPVTTALRTG